MMLESKTQRIFLFIAVITFTISGIMGIIAVLIGRFNPFWSKIFGTSMTIGFASIFALICVTTHFQKAARPSGILGLLATLVTTINVLIIVWAEIDLSQIDWFRNTHVSSALAAISLTFVGLLAVAELKPGWFRWTRIITWVAIAVLNVCGNYLIWIDDRNDLVMRLAIISSIISIFGAGSVFVLQRVTWLDRRRLTPAAGINGAIEIFCPRCKNTVKLPVGKSACDNCGLVIEIKCYEPQK